MTDESIAAGWASKNREQDIQGGRTMRYVPKPAIFVSVVAAFALAVGAGGLGATSAQNPITVELLTPRSEFTDKVSGQFRDKVAGQGTNVVNMRDASRVVMARITVQPGAMFPWHTHPGPVVVNVAEGELVYVAASDCVERPYPAGTAFVDPGHGFVHTAFNPTNEVTVLYATFFQAPPTGPLTITEGVEPPADCDVDASTDHNH